MNASKQQDLISLLANSDATRDADAMGFPGNVLLLIVRGSDTVRNTLSGGVHALSTFPDEYDKLKQNPGLVIGAVAEMIRWRTPLTYMRRTVTRNCRLHGQFRRKGEKAVLRYVSGNRDDLAIPKANEFIGDRKQSRCRLAFGSGIHRCVGERLAYLQLSILWEDRLANLPRAQVVEPPERVHSTSRPFSLLTMMTFTRRSWKSGSI